jgi:hypothetical protein
MLNMTGPLKEALLTRSPQCHDLGYASPGIDVERLRIEPAGAQTISASLMPELPQSRGSPLTDHEPVTGTLRFSCEPKLITAMLAQQQRSPISTISLSITRSDRPADRPTRGKRK